MSKFYRLRPSKNWLRLFMPALFVLSLALHGLLLVFPLPSGSQDATESEEPEAEEEKPVDLLSISGLSDAPEPVAEEAPPPETTSAPPPAAPTQPVVPETYPPPEAVPPEPSPESLVEPDVGLEPDPEVPLGGFDPNRQSQLAGNALGAFGRTASGEVNSFDVTDQFLELGAPLFQQLPPSNQQCFFQELNPPQPTLASGAIDFKFLLRNPRQVVGQDFPRTFPSQEVIGTGEFCGYPLYEVRENGTPLLWISLIGLGQGAEGSTTVVMLWGQAPR